MERHFYSVPYALEHQEVDVHVTGDTIEILHHGVRVGFACSLLGAGESSDATRAYAQGASEARGADAFALIEDAQQVGPVTGQLVEAILAAKRHPEPGYRSCLGILRLAEDVSSGAHGSGRAAACGHAPTIFRAWTRS